MSDDLASLRAELDRPRAERDALALALREQREQLRVAFDHVPAPVSVVSLAEMRFLYVNQAYEDFSSRFSPGISFASSAAFSTSVCPGAPPRPNIATRSALVLSATAGSAHRRGASAATILPCARGSPRPTRG